MLNVNYIMLHHAIMIYFQWVFIRLHCRMPLIGLQLRKFVVHNVHTFFSVCAVCGRVGFGIRCESNTIHIAIARTASVRADICVDFIRIVNRFYFIFISDFHFEVEFDRGAVAHNKKANITFVLCCNKFQIPFIIEILYEWWLHYKSVLFNYGILLAVSYIYIYTYARFINLKSLRHHFTHNRVKYS